PVSCYAALLIRHLASAVRRQRRRSLGMYLAAVVDERADPPARGGEGRAVSLGDFGGSRLQWRRGAALAPDRRAADAPGRLPGHPPEPRPLARALGRDAGPSPRGAPEPRAAGRDRASPLPAPPGAGRHVVYAWVHRGRDPRAAHPRGETGSQPGVAAGRAATGRASLPALLRWKARGGGRACPPHRGKAARGRRRPPLPIHTGRPRARARPPPA